ncbi:MAG: translation initiation factor IF-2 [Leptolyngbyaceae bacterium]|nr:translation initiation factor IF-2 [Leptolyngbyaceae bacterium]
MNNGKVRIYELSKELDLENRDILAVCEQLDIAAKSHSSTITDEDAVRIRSVASEKFTRRSAPPKKKVIGKSNGSPSRTSGSKAPIKKRPQILEVRRKAPSKDAVDSPELAAKPQVNRPAASVMAPSAKEGIPERLAQPPAMTEPPQRSQLRTVEEEIPAEVPETVPDNGASNEPSRPAPQLVAPPARPSLRKPKSEQTDSSDQSESAPSARDSKPPIQRELKSPSVRVQEAKTPELRSPRAPVSPEEAAAPERDKPSLVPKPSKPKLKKPVARPVDEPDARKSKSQDAEEEADTIDGDSAPIDQVVELRRPTPPRAPKKSKHREESEPDDDQELLDKQKAKPKRRQPIIKDDDDDLDVSFDDDDTDEFGDESGASQISLSLMRPPKPKALSGQQNKPAASSSGPRKKKSTAPRESKSQRRDRREKSQEQQRPEILILEDSISLHDLAERLKVPETEIIRSLFFKGIAANINQILDVPTATMVAEEFDVLVEAGEAEAEAKKTTEMIDAGDLDKLLRRPPVVTIMGHVDHGKTTLLDSIRKTKVAQGEAGGITQHIGAYHVDVDHNGETQQIVFLDTPGHEAFTAMRARGTRVTDIAVLVVAADDGVRPQTIEAIKHAQAAEVPIVVAINKIDKEGAQPDRVKQELMEHSLVPEEWGGETIMVPVSALNGENLDGLLEMILLVSEVEDLYANPDRPAKGTVIEANLDKARGPVATLLVQNGTLRIGESIVVGSVFGKVRAMIDDRGKRVDEATPSFAVEVLGLGDVPAAGDEFDVYYEEKEARSVASQRADQQRLSRLQQAMASRRVSLNTLSAQAQEGDLKELNLVLKADVQGSVEAILASLQQLPQEEVQVRVLFAAPGEISETDVDLAAASNAVIIGFNTTLASGARQAADRAGVDIRDYDIIYKLLEDIEGAMEGLLEPELVEEPLGEVEVRAVFPVGRGAVAGCYVLSGKAVRNCRIRVKRDGEVVFEGNLDSLKRVKDDVKEVNAGYECGIGIDSFADWKEGDRIDTFKMVTKRRKLASAKNSKS